MRRGVCKTLHTPRLVPDAIRCDRPSEMCSWKSFTGHTSRAYATRSHAYPLVDFSFTPRKLSVAGGTSTAALPAAPSCFQAVRQMLLPSKVPSSSGTSAHLRTKRKRFLFSIIFASSTPLFCLEKKLSRVNFELYFSIGIYCLCFFFINNLLFFFILLQLHYS